MSAASIAALAAVVALPAALFVVFLSGWDHARYKRRYILTTLAAGFLAFVPMQIVLTLIQRWTGLAAFGQGGGLAAYIYAFLLAAPLAQGLKVLAVWPAVRARKVEAPIDGIAYAAAAALGFVSAQNAVFLYGHQPLSIGFLASGDFLGLVRPGLTGAQIAAIQADPKINDIQKNAASGFGTEGSSFGLAGGATLVAGLHF